MAGERISIPTLARSLQRHMLKLVAGALLCGIALAQAQEQPPSTIAKAVTPDIPEYVFAVHPLHTPERLFAVYGPLTEHLTAQIPGARFRLEASRSYEDYERKLYAGSFHFSLPNPYQTVHAIQHGYRVFAKMGDDYNFRGIILVRRDGGIEKIADLKGKKVAFPAATALAATIMPQYYLHTHGLNVITDIESVYVGSQESSILNVYHSLVAAGATWPVPWMQFSERFPDKAAELEVKWETDFLPNNSLVVRNDVPQALTEKVASVFLKLHETESGRALLKTMSISRFEPADNNTYAPVKTYLLRFSNEVKPLGE